MNKTIIYSVGGPVQEKSGEYIRRQADQELLDLCRKGVYAYVLASRQVGKSSLMFETEKRLREKGLATTIINFNKIGYAEKADQWYITQLTQVAEDFHLSINVSAWWHERPDLTVTDRFARFYEEEVLSRISSNVVIFFDEIEETLKLPYGSDFFVVIRSLYNARVTEPELRRLSFVLIGSARPSDLIKDPKRTPFNIGQRIDLTDFTLEEAKPLAGGFNLPPPQALQVLQWILQWTGGHPYLTQCLCVALATEKRPAWTKADVDDLVTRTFFGKQGEKDSNLDTVRSMLTERAPDKLAVLTTYRRILGAPYRVRDEEQSPIIAHLKLAGIVRSENYKLRVRTLIYQKVFNRRWIRENLPVKWWQTVPRWALAGAALILVLMIVAVIFIKLYADNVARDSRRLDEERIRVAAETRQKEQADSTLRVAQDSLNVLQANTRQQTAAIRLFGVINNFSQRVRNYPNDLLTDKEALMACQAYLFNKTLGSQYENKIYEALNAALSAPYFSAIVGSHQAGITAIAFSRDGHRLTAAGADGMVMIWNVQTHAPNPISAQLHADSVFALAFSPGGELLASGSKAGLIKLWDWKKNRVTSLPEKVSGLRALAWSPEQNLLIAGGKDGNLRLWNMSSSSPPKPQVLPHGSPIYALAISGDGKTFAAGGLDGVARIWNIKKLQSKPKAFKHQSKINALAFSRDGKRLATAGDDAKALVWEADNQNDKGGEFFTKDKNKNGIFGAVALSPDGRNMAVGNSLGYIFTWSPGQLSQGPELAAHAKTEIRNSYIQSLAFSPDGSLLASGSRAGTVRLWHLLQPKDTVSVLKAHVGRVKSVVFDPNGMRFVSGGDDEKVFIWNLNPFSFAPTTLPAQKSPVRALAFSPNGRFIASGSDKNGEVRIWRTNKLKDDPITRKEQTQGVFALAFNPEGATLAAGSKNGTITFWEGEAFRYNSALDLKHDREGSVRSLAFSPDGKSLISAGGQGSLIVWDYGKTKITPKNKKNVPDISSVAISPDGSKLAIGGDDGKLHLWNFPSLNPIQVLNTEKGLAIKAVTFSRDTTMLAAASADGSIRLWDLRRLKAPLIFKGHSSAATAVSFSPDNQKLVSCGDDATVRIWRTRLDLMAQRLCEEKLWRNLSAQEWNEFGEGLAREKTRDKILAESASTKLSKALAQSSTKRSMP